MSEEQYSLKRKMMVEQQLIPRGITDLSTLNSMSEVPRHLFIPEERRLYAYEDGPIVIGSGQTISQPYMVALMTQAAECEPNAKVLDVGTGSGYAAAVFSRFCSHVYSIERIPSLANQAKELFSTLQYDNITVTVGDGTLGFPEKAPYDAIVVTAGAPATPEPLIQQLKVGGKLIIPVGDSRRQKLMRYRKLDEGHIEEELLEYVRFVPLIGEKGWEGFTK